MSCLTCSALMGYYFDKLFVVRFILTEFLSADEGEVDIGVAVALGSLAVHHAQLENQRKSLNDQILDYFSVQ